MAMFTSDDSDAAFWEEIGDTNTRLGYERTRIASERTLMAWVRTSVSLISFGFSIPRFFEYLEAGKVLHGPKLLGIGLIALGTLGLAVGIVEHMRLLSRLGVSAPLRARISMGVFAAATVFVIGLLALVSVIAS